MVIITEPLTLADARKVMMHAYFLSQGSYPLQKLLFSYVSLIRPNWRLDEAMCQDLMRLAPTLRALIDNPALHGPQGEASVESSLTSEIHAMRTELGLPIGELDEATWLEIHCNLVAEFVGRDYHYLCEETSRPRSVGGAASVHPRRDPHLSLFCHYVLLGHKIGCAVLDEMLANMAATVQQAPNLLSLKAYFPSDEECDLTVERLAAVVAVYNRWHPHSPVSFPEH